MAAAVPVPVPGPARVPEEELPPLDPAEVRNRLEHSERQFRNRRKVLIRGLPADVSNQDVQELLKDFELKYCFVDRHKGLAFLTFQSPAQASQALQSLQGRSLRGSRLLLQLQAPDSVLCVANLPRLLSHRQFQELLRPFGNLERCFLVYSPSTGHSKGYGFVEFTKKDSAARARSELLGKALGSRDLYVHWAQGSELSPERLHSRCLCVDRLAPGYGDSRELARLAAAVCEPEFCQVAVGQDGQLQGFAVLEFPSPEAAERVQAALDGTALAGSRIRASFCAPGPAGRCMLAALTAARATAQSRGKGLLPDPSVLEILSSLGNPALVQLLLGPLLHGARRGLLAAPPSLAPALLQLALLRQPQKPGILGDSPLAQPSRKLLGEIPAGAPGASLRPPGAPLGPPGAPRAPLGPPRATLGPPGASLGPPRPPGAPLRPPGAPLGPPRAPLGAPGPPLGPPGPPLRPPGAPLGPSGAPLGPSGPPLRPSGAPLGPPRPTGASLRPPRSPLGASLGPPGPTGAPLGPPGATRAPRALLGPPGPPLGAPLGPPGASLGPPGPSLGPSGASLRPPRTPGAPLGPPGASLRPPGPPGSPLGPPGPPLGAPLGPPGASLRPPRTPGASLRPPGPLGSPLGPPLGPPGASLGPSGPPGAPLGPPRTPGASLGPPGPPLGASLRPPRTPGAPLGAPLGPSGASLGPPRPPGSPLGPPGPPGSPLGPPGSPLGPPGPPLGAPPFLPGSPSSCFSSGLRAGLRQSHMGKAVPKSSESVLALAPPSSHLKTPLGGQKRGFAHLLPSPEPSPEGCYVGQHSQGLGGHYADSYLKRKRIF